MGAHVKHVIGFVVGILIAAAINTQLGGARSSQPTQSVSSFADRGAVDKWMHNYYLHPEPARVVDAIVTLSAQGVLKEAPRSTMIAAFVAGAIEHDPSLLDTLCSRLKDAPLDQQRVLAMAVAFTGRKDLLVRVKSGLPRLNGIDKLASDPSARHVLQTPVEKSALGLDMQWAYFMATGKEEPVLRIISTLPGINETEDAHRFASAHAARWSLGSMAGLHPKVMQISRAAAANASEPLAAILRDVIEAAETRTHNRFRGEAQDAARAWKARQQDSKI
jgi:hypothetical protein